LVLAIVRQAAARLAALSESDSVQNGPVCCAMAEKLYSDRRRRDDYFPRELFGEPAWDLLLALFIAMEDGRDLDLAKAYDAAKVDPAYGPAVIDKLVATGMVVRSRGQHDKRRNTVVLTDQAEERMTNYLIDIG
jgi:DNA-binding MarR family transcriptional regulator